MALYFAYGSNMSRKQMIDRCASAHLRSRGHVKGYRLAFPRRSRRWGGGVAGIEPDAGCCVEGVAYELTEEDLHTLDGFEGVADLRYRREKVVVELGDGSLEEAEVYFACSEPGGPFQPSAQYLETMIEGAVEHGLSQKYIGELRGRLVI